MKIIQTEGVRSSLCNTYKTDGNAGESELKDVQMMRHSSYETLSGVNTALLSESDPGVCMALCCGSPQAYHMTAQPAHSAL